MFGFFNISCEQANVICNKSQYGEATFKEKIMLSLHLLTCKFCALYAKQNNTITQIFKNKAKNCKGEMFFLTNEEKQRIKDKLKEFV